MGRQCRFAIAIIIIVVILPIASFASITVAAATPSSIGQSTGANLDVLNETNTDDLLGTSDEDESGSNDTADDLAGTVDDVEDVIDEVDDAIDDSADEVEDTVEAVDEDIEETSDNTEDVDDAVSETNDTVGESTEESNDTTTENGRIVDLKIDDDDELQVLDEPIFGKIDNTSADVESSVRLIEDSVNVTLVDELGLELTVVSSVNATIVFIDGAVYETTTILRATVDQLDLRATDALLDSIAERENSQSEDERGTPGIEAPADQKDSVESERPEPEPSASSNSDGHNTTDDTAPISFGLEQVGTVVLASSIGLIIGALATCVSGLTTGLGSSIVPTAGRTSIPSVGRVVPSFERFVGSLFRYSRYDDSDPLEHDGRLAVYETIVANPGIYLSQIESTNTGTLSTVRHHLRVLEEEHLISSEKHRGKRRFVAIEEEYTELAAALSDQATMKVLETLAAIEPASNRQLADRLNRDPATISHHLTGLEAAGLVNRTKDGRVIINRTAPRVQRALDRQSTVSDADKVHM